MAGVRITLIGGPHEWVLPMFDGIVQPKGIDLAVTRSPPPQAMRRQLSTWEFDVSEMAFGAYLIARAQGADIVGIPAFPMRGFFHTSFACHVDANIRHPADLAKKRVGIPEYIQTGGGLWGRGILVRDFGIDPRQVHWYVERSGADSTGAVLGFAPPKGIAVEQTPGGKSLAAMLIAHELDAAHVGRIPAATSAGKVRLLFSDVVAEGKRFFDKHGYVPANHCYVIRGDVLRKYPWAADSLYQAFKEAKALAQRSLSERIPAGLIFGGEYLARNREMFGDDPFAYGVATNRAMLETVVRLSQEQGLITETPSVEQLFTTGMSD